MKVIGIIVLLSMITSLAASIPVPQGMSSPEQLTDDRCNQQTATSPITLNLNEVSIGDTSLTTDSQAKKIADTDVKKLIKLLNKAYSDEWLSYYQNWIGSKIVRGPNKEAVIAELTLHATEELGHAVLLTTRIIQLGGTPVTEPQDWFKLTNCVYHAPNDPYVIKVLEQNINSEQCSIKTYDSLLEKVRDQDPVTYNIILGIKQMEVEHEEDLQALLDDITVMTNP
jgi:bacterioferritin